MSNDLKIFERYNLTVSTPISELAPSIKTFFEHMFYLEAFQASTCFAPI